MSTAQSVSLWIAQIKEQGDDAAQRLWSRYSTQLVAQARRLLKDYPKRLGDEEDVALSVFHSLCRGAAAGRFENVRNRDELWWLLLAITKRKAVDHLRRETAEKRGASKIRHSSNSDISYRWSACSIDDLVSEEPPPDFVLMLEEQHDRLLNLLGDDRLRRIATFRIEGYTVPEIAADCDVTTRTVERKLQLIRDIWSQELG